MFYRFKSSYARKLARKSKTHARVRVESLESRRLLAGDVLVNVVDGDLVIDGDRLSNGVEIYQPPDGVDGWVVRGLISADGDVTTINGAEFVRVGSVTGDIVAHMRSGDDTVYIHDAELPGNLNVRTGSGDDLVLIGGLPRDYSPQPRPIPVGSVDAVLSTETVAPADLDVDEPISINPVPILPISNVTIAGSARISTAGGADRIGMGSVEVLRNLGIATGSGDDHLTLGLNQLPTPAEDTAKHGSDSRADISLPLNVYGSLNLNTHTGDDAAWLESVYVGRNLTAKLSRGDDVLAYHVGAVDGSINIYGSNGDDIIAVANVSTERLAIRAGNGNDGVGLANVHASRIGVGLGSGNDQMRVSDTRARVARFHGGRGTDSIEFQGENHLQDLKLLSFEIIS